MNTEANTEPVRSLSKPQRRVLGVLLEKAFTTPEAYPLTLKGLTTGCNQKSNRSPLANYDESDVYNTVEKLRELGLAAVVHTESGRTERYRHYVRKKYTFTEPQLAIMTELLLRGRQTLGDLRARASRMVPIESLTELRQELDALLDAGYLQATMELERRGAEVDHTFYEPQEQKSLPIRSTSGSNAGTPTTPPANTAATHSPPAHGATTNQIIDEPEDNLTPVPGSATEETLARRATTSASPQPPAAENEELHQELQDLRQEYRQIKQDLEEIRTQFDDLQQLVSEIRRDLGM